MWTMNDSLVKNIAMPIRLTLLAAIVLLMASIQDGAISNGQSSQGNPLGGKSFKIKSRIRSSQTLDGISSSIKTVAYIEENYSHEQGRANLIIKLGGDESDRGDTLYKLQLDLVRNAKLLLDLKGKICTVDDKFVGQNEDLQKFLYGHAKLPVSLSCTTLDCPEYIVGPSKFFYFAFKHRDRMQLSSLEPTSEIRNIPCLDYKFTMDTEQYGQVEFSASYSEQSLTADKNSPPLYVSLSYGDSKFLSIEFWDLSIGPDVTLDDGNAKGIEHDPFMFDTSEQCLQALIKTQRNIFSQTMDSRKFSFNARVRHTSDLKSREGLYSVAFDAGLDSMRVDRLDEPYSKRTQLYNFKTKKVYDIQTAATGSENTCISNEILPAEGSSLGKLLLGSDKFVYMGKARARGIDSLAYRVEHSKTPSWLQRMGMGNSLSNDRDDMGAMVYVAEEHEQSISYPRILHVALKHSKGSTTEIDYHNFDWDLVMENGVGTKLIDYFSLRKPCNKKLSSGFIYLQMTFERAQENSDHGASDLLNTALMRNMEILKSLHKTFNFNINLIQDLESKLLNENQQFLKVIFKFTDYDIETSTVNLFLANLNGLVDTEVSLGGYKYKLREFSRLNHQQAIGDEVFQVIRDNKSHQLSLSKVFGIGLIADSIHSKQIDSVGSCEGPTEMTIDQCRSICLLDYNCHSYSVCLDRQEVKCIISQLSFYSKDLISEIYFKSVNLREGTKFTVNASPESVNLIKRRNCQLYNRQNLNLFLETQQLKLTELNGRGMFAMQTIEQCATKCFENNVHLLEHGLNEIDHLHHHEEPQDWMSIITRHKQKAREICDLIAYLTSDELEQMSNLARRDSIKKMIIPSTGPNPSLVYCLIGRRASRDEEAKLALVDNEHSSYLEAYLKEYQFDIRLFYERRPGISLKQSLKTSEQLIAYKKISSNQADATHLEEMKRFLEKHENSQQVSITNEFLCATKCLMQLGHLWPACKSFDLVQKVNPNTGELVSHCYLNSVTLQEVKSHQRDDLIELRSSPDERERWHYEPKKSLNLDVSFMMQTIAEKPRSSKLGSFSVTIIVLTSGLLGISLGLLIAQRLRYIIILESRRHSRMIESLVEQSRIEYTFPVSFESTFANESL